MPRLKLPKSVLMDDLDLPGGPNQISSRIIEHTRWSVHYEIIFKYGGKTYRTTYSIGATESQDEMPWQWDETDIECEEVHQVERLQKVWEPVSV